MIDHRRSQAAGDVELINQEASNSVNSANRDGNDKGPVPAPHGAEIDDPNGVSP
jgi:hypothetical protein